MVRSHGRLLRGSALVAAVALALAACGTSGSSQSAGTSGSAAPSSSASGGAGTPTAGGTIYYLSNAEQFDQVDPQRVYTGEDLAFFGATIYRSLVSYTTSPDATTADKLVPDMATDTGTASSDAKTWTFTLRDGLTFQDGSPITCADVAYGTSRTFATDVINQGPTYQIQYLDIPTNSDGSSQYPGPYKATAAQQALFDKAVECKDAKTIVFHLNQPVADFNYTTTLGFNPVPNPKDHPGVDKGESYGDSPVSSGPYMIQSYQTGKGGKMILVRNPKWNADSDPIRKAYPDKWEVDFGLDPKVIDQRFMGDSGNDQYAIQFGVQPENLTTVFSDVETPTADFQGRAYSALDPYVRYYWINVQKVKNVKIRQAMAVALDRGAIRTNGGGAFAGDLGDGLIKPNLGDQYAPTGMWTGLLGQNIPDNGDPAYAKTLIQQSGEAAPTLTWDYPTNPTRDKEAAIVKSSLEAAGFKVNLNPIEPGQYYSIVFDSTKSHEFGWAGWGPDWPNASTIIPPLTTVKGGWDISRVCDPKCSAADDPQWLDKIQAALGELDHAKQATMWQDLNKEASQNVFTIPTTFGRTERMAGSKVKPVYNWAPYGSWPYYAMYVVQ